MTASRISVALCTHNGARYLAEQLRSILNQTRPVDEIVLSDDASSDGTVELAEGILAEHREQDGAPATTPSLIVLRNDPPLGVTANFEQALRAATGGFIALSDQDDVWHPDRIARALAAFEARPELRIVASEARLIDDAGEPLPRTLFDTLGMGDATLARIAAGGASAELLKRNILTGATMMVRRELVEAAVPFPASWVHDEWLAIVAAFTGGVELIRDPLIDYRQHGANQIGVTKLGLGGKVGRLTAPRTERNARLLARAADLAERLPEIIPHDDRARRLTTDKLDHERARIALPEGRLRRILPVLAELRTGRYWRYGLGAQDVVRDLVQPVERRQPGERQQP